MPEFATAPRYIEIISVPKGVLWLIFKLKNNHLASGVLQ